jgi:aldose 1-epimerase
MSQMSLRPQAGIRVLQRAAFQTPARTLGPQQGAAVDLFTLRNRAGAVANICNYGARVVQLLMPDASGVLGDVALGFNDWAALQRPSPSGVPSMGAFIGRYANRIAGGRFVLDGAAQQLPPNSGPHCIHGGAGGSRYAVFAAVQTADNQLALRHRFTPQNDGFPAQLDLCVTYTLTQNNALSVAWQANALDAPTVASFTSHIFFNLTSCVRSTVDEHVLQLKAAHYLPLRADQSPTGELLAVGGTPFDFRQPQRIGQHLHSPHPHIAQCGGYDHHFAVDGWDKRLQTIATVQAPSSGRTLTVSSTEPGVQLFTANGLDAAQCGFGRHSGLCIEPSYFPDSPNHPHFPSTRLEAGQVRVGEIIYAFGVG